MIPVYFEDGETTALVEDEVYQYDYGQVLAIHGLTDMPDITEVDFAVSEKGGMSYPTTAITSDGITYAQVQDFLLANDDVDYNYKIYAFVRTTDDQSGETIRKVVIPIKSRPKNTDYVTPDEPDPFGVAIEMIRRYKEECIESAEKCENAVASIDEKTESSLTAIEESKEDALERIAEASKGLDVYIDGDTLFIKFDREEGG